MSRYVEPSVRVSENMIGCERGRRKAIERPHTFVTHTRKGDSHSGKNLRHTYHASLEVLLGELVHRVNEEGAAIHIHGGTDHEIGGRVEVSVRALGRAGVADNAHVALQRWEEKGEEIGEREKREKSTVVRKYDSSDEKTLFLKHSREKKKKKEKVSLIFCPQPVCFEHALSGETRNRSTETVQCAPAALPWAAAAS